ncbi:MAG: glycosyl hydrolase [Paludibacter sp.]|nr:glycosyl hydrolase [Paludibacter sp.]
MKKSYRFLYLIILSGMMALPLSGKATQKYIQTTAELKSLFADPPMEYRSAPFWDWNGQISKEGIDFQLKEFKKAGIGSLFIHPRPGLITEYLSDEWFQLFDYAVGKGKELGMKIWIYDENSYPSGFAGGHVPAEMPDSYQHGIALLLSVQEKLQITPSDTIEVVLKKTAQGFQDITASVAQENGQKGSYYVFRKAYPPKSPWYGGFTYVDLLYKGVTEKFIDITMTRGYERNKSDFGKDVPGIFTDEPNLEAPMRGADMRWTPDLWPAFQQRWGYDLRINLPSLFKETGNWKKVRHDYYQLLLELFVDCWAKPWYKYTEANRLIWTGHYWEHGWPEPTHGFDEAAFYIWHQMPGIDMLGNKLDTEGLGGQFGNDRAVRELRSAANQAGWTRTLSETYGGGGWEMNFKTQKRLVDWQGVLGVNFVNQHLSYYSINGVRKFDYPPSFSYHEPWWKHYKLMGDYIGRISMAMAAGQQINTTLVLQPNSTAWMYFSRKDKHPAIGTIRDGFKNFVYRLEQQHIEYDLGSEAVLSELGSVAGKTLRVGKRDYTLVVIPAEMENLNQKTFELLKQFLEDGGKVLSFNRNITHIDGNESLKVNELAASYPLQWTFADKLSDTTAMRLLKGNEFVMDDHTKNGMLYHQRRICDDGQILFFVNSHPSKNATAEVTITGKYVTLLNPVSGDIHTYPSKTNKGKVTFRIKLDPVGSSLFIISDKKPEVPEYNPPTGKEIVVAASGSVKVKRESENVLMINYLDLKTAKSEQKDIYFMNALISLFRENGVEMGNPWQHKIQYKKDYLALDTLFKKDSGFEISYHFSINNDLSAAVMKNIEAVVEFPDLWKVYINGHEVSEIEDKYWIEKDFPVYAIGKYLQKGNNTINLKAVRMNVLAEVMPIYILGDFLVKPATSKGFEICSGDITQTSSWRDAGLPFYSQEVSYTQSFRIDKNKGSAYKVKLNKWNGSIAEVLVNGKTAGLIAWQPEELDVTSLLKNGTNEITIKVTGSLKNTFGFFFQKNSGWLFGPGTWNNAPEHAPDAKGYFLMDYGMMEVFELKEIK